MEWTEFKGQDQLEEIIEQSREGAVMIFKHSTRCSISAMVLSRLERSWKEADSEKLKPYYLDLINYRDISSQVAEEFDIPHESPQVIVLKDGKPIHASSHMGISYSDLLSKA